MPSHPVVLYEGVELTRQLLLPWSQPVLQPRTADHGITGTTLVSPPRQPLKETLSPSIDVNALEGPYVSVLHTAAYKGHLKMLQMLVEKYNAHIIATDWLGRTPLHLAARATV